MSHHLLEMRDVHFAYGKGPEVLRGVSFRLTHGEAAALVGANGAGKSTLLLHLVGILMPSAGAVRIGDLPLTRSTLTQIRRTVGLVFQDPDDQLFMPTVREDVAFGPLNMGLPVEEVRSRVQAALETVGAAHLADRPPYKLSGGEKRAVSIATVLAMAPSILVMDEPSAGLDPRARRRLLEMLRGFAHTKIIATHDLDLALEVCPRTIVLHDGRVAADGPTREIFADGELMERCGLERPNLTPGPFPEGKGSQ